MQLEAWLLPLTPPANTQISGPVWKTTLDHANNPRYNPTFSIQGIFYPG